MTRESTPAAGIARGALASVLVAILGTGCTTVSMATAPAVVVDSPTASLTVRTFDRSKDVAAGHLSAARVVSTLMAKDGAVRRVEGAEAAFDGLTPGDYQLTVRLWKGGNTAEENPTAEKSKSVSLRAGSRATTEVVLQRTSVGTIALVVVGALAAVAIVGAISLNNTGVMEEGRFAAPETEGRAFSPVPGQRPSTPSQPRVE